ncbi:hypothetical protein OSB04_020822 [Centaurea solstitialis]|uniref:Uncharacterized protein n=1 Tax=Centaurea solstitialis TaxID=347529 RepID=A0AA38ST09_9ASTR|nr:hypothetical protein OSB04_020822 [Centaurea solstitialis]
MPSASLDSSSLSSPKVDVIIDTGSPFFNHTVDGFLKIGAVAVVKTVTEETYQVVRRDLIIKAMFGKLADKPVGPMTDKVAYLTTDKSSTFLGFHLIVSLDLHFSGSVSQHNLEDAVRY